MQAFIGNLEAHTIANRDFRQVLWTGPHLQLVLMSLPQGGEVGEEVHEDTDQFFRIEEGLGEVLIEGRATAVRSGSAIVVPAGARHNIRNTGVKPLRMYTLYAPPHHAVGTVHHTRADAMEAQTAGKH
jgi:mannose-6-phosphate isomerase-like protein (cupin superfamily)